MDSPPLRWVFPPGGYGEGIGLPCVILMWSWNYLNPLEPAWLRQLHPQATFRNCQRNNARVQVAWAECDGKLWKVENFRWDRLIPEGLHQKDTRTAQRRSQSWTWPYHQFWRWRTMHCWPSLNLRSLVFRVECWVALRHLKFQIKWSKNCKNATH